MTDNTVLPTGGGGDAIRDIDRAGIKTQVIIIDVGGQAGPESLVVPGNPLPVTDPKIPVQGQAPSSGSLPVVLASDQPPVNVSITGIAVPVTNSADGIPLAVQLTASDINSIINPVPVTGSLAATIPAIAQTLGAINAVGGIVGPILLNGAPRVLVIASGTYGNATIALEVANNDPVNGPWFGARAVRQVNTFLEGIAAGAFVLTANASQADNVDVAGWSYFRIRATAFVSGVLNISIAPSYGGGVAVVAAVATGQTADGVAAQGFPVRVGGIDTGGGARSFLTDLLGQLYVNQGVANVVPWAQNLTQINGAAPSVANPLPVQISDGSKAQDLLSAFQSLTMVELLNLRFAANAADLSGGGFVPVEIPSFLGA